VEVVLALWQRDSTSVSHFYSLSVNSSAHPSMM
jgi:hypothetical protein